MAKNVNATKLGRIGKRDAVLEDSLVIKTVKATGEKSLESEIGNMSSQGMGSIKRVETGIQTPGMGLNVGDYKVKNTIQRG